MWHLVLGWSSAREFFEAFNELIWTASGDLSPDDWQALLKEAHELLARIRQENPPTIVGA